MATSKEPRNATNDSSDAVSAEFQELKRAIVVAEIRAMIRRLQDSGEFALPASIRLEELDLRGLDFIKRQLRDTLRTLGGGR